MGTFHKQNEKRATFTILYVKFMFFNAFAVENTSREEILSSRKEK